MVVEERSKSGHVVESSGSRRRLETTPRGRPEDPAQTGTLPPVSVEGVENWKEVRVTVPSHVMSRELDGELVLLDLEGEQYFGLDTVGTDMFRLLADGATIGDVHEELTKTYDVEPDQLRGDLMALVRELLEAGLLQRP